MKKSATRRYGALAAILSLAAFGGGAERARANCVEPAPSLVWSYPADGATDVPTNARVFILTSTWQHLPPQIVVNGVAVARGQVPYSYEPLLAPGTEYLVTLPSGGSRPVQLSFRFTTGTGVVPAPSPVPARVDRVTTAATRELTPACQAAWQTIDCFDTGQNTHLIFETEQRPLYWLVERKVGASGEWSFPRLWPGPCGPPADFVDGRLIRCHETSYRLTTVALTGQTMVAEVGCPASSNGAGGCAIGARGSTAWFAASLAATLVTLSLARRRRRRFRPRV